MNKHFLALCFLFLSTLCFSQTNDSDDKVNFSEDFKRKNQGKYIVEIDEVKELIHIMLALTDFGLGNDDMFQQKGQYYQDLMTNFKPYKEEKIIKTFDSLMNANPLNYIFLTGNAITQNFDDNGNLVQSKTFLFPATSVSSHTKISVNPILTYKAQIEDFALKTNFRTFYKKHKPFYNSLIEDYYANANVKKQWKWLEKNFKTKINSYEILCSPLINGLNYTTAFENNHFTLIQMILPPLDHDDQKSAKSNEAFNTRGMFTEIDHNYVRTPSNQHKNQIETALNNREKWVNNKMEGTEYYPNPVKVFDEYMTFGVYLLYAKDTYKDDKLFNEILNEVNSVMANQRGFVKMADFSTKLLELRAKNKRKKIDDLYPELLEWCRTQ